LADVALALNRPGVIFKKCDRTTEVESLRFPAFRISEGVSKRGDDHDHGSFLADIATFDP
jgi:hypothetical protein